MRKVYIIAIVVASIIFLAACAAMVVGSLQRQQSRHEKSIQQKEAINQHVIDSLTARHSAELLLARNYAWSIQHERDSLVQVINTRISKIKTVYDKEVDHVALLAPDSLLGLVSGQLSRQRR